MLELTSFHSCDSLLHNTYDRTDTAEGAKVMVYSRLNQSAPRNPRTQDAKALLYFFFFLMM